MRQVASLAALVASLRTRGNGMSKAIEFKIPPGAILFSADGVGYEFREDLGPTHHGMSLFVARLRNSSGEPRGKVLLKAVPAPSEKEGGRVRRARAKLDEQVRLAASLSHPAILKVHGLHKVEGYWYVSAEHPSGNSLNELLTLVVECRRWFSPLFVMFVGSQVAAALEHAHTAKDASGRPLNIVHRAIDVAHIFMDWDGTVRLGDFGLALSNLPGRVASSVRGPRGDYFYSSPEMLLGGPVDARSDLFMLGVVLLEMATGKNLLFHPDAITPEVMGSLSVKRRRRVVQAIKRATLAGASPMVEDAIWRAATLTDADVDAMTEGLPQGLRVTLNRLLRVSPRERYQSAGELAADLAAWIGGTFTKADAAAELRARAAQAEEALDALGLTPPRGRGKRHPDDVTTS
ncbi:protein kinase [Myxococcus xanthus]|uniref:non-specific serine/threonine protein kinase n=1 Tax=Myxococcus xanthus TaxID=34 RepID=A0AAE6G372_MYXXA|nr:protein kinase [Myxococcus xanthus]QDE69826.1 protein kinase [Myxococcus xanthus]QDE77105.1 protein kinase [Myxococcus xanthus]